MTKKQSERQKKILEIVVREHKIEVASLASSLGVSKVTLRKDLEKLSLKGIVRHEKGRVFPGSSDDINNRLTYHYDTKLKIANRACELISDGETVMIESGSCCAILAEKMTMNIRGSGIITNSAFIAFYVRRLPNAKIVLLGGDYQKDSQVLVGPIVRDCLKNFTVDKFFIGADGFSEKNGFTGKDHMRAETVRDMAKKANKVIILAESEKFYQQSLVYLLPFADVAVVITDDALNPETEKIFTGHGITVYKVPK